MSEFSIEGQGAYFYDGDTVYFDGEGYRAEQFNTAEKGTPLGELQHQIVKDFTSNGGTVEHGFFQGKGAHGRNLATFKNADGKDITKDLVRVGAAFPNWTSDEEVKRDFESYLTATQLGLEPQNLTNQQKKAFQQIEALRNQPGTFFFDPKNIQLAGVPKKQGIVSASIDRGTDQLHASLYSFAKVAGQALGSKNLERYGNMGVVRNIYEAMENPAEIQSWDDVDGLADFATFATELVFEEAPGLALDAGMALTGGGVGMVLGRRAALAGASKMTKAAVGKEITRKMQGSFMNFKNGVRTGAFASIYPQMVGETGLELDAEGVEAPITALGVGGLKTATEYFGLSKAFGGMAKSLGTSVDNLYQLTGQVAKKAGINVGIEGTTEGIQQAMDLAAVAANKEGFDWNTPENWDKIVDAAIAGGIVGGTISGVGTGAIGGAKLANKSLSVPKAGEQGELDLDSVLTTPEKFEDLVAQIKHAAELPNEKPGILIPQLQNSSEKLRLRVAAFEAGLVKDKSYKGQGERFINPNINTEKVLGTEQLTLEELGQLNIPFDGLVFRKDGKPYNKAGAVQRARQLTRNTGKSYTAIQVQDKDNNYWAVAPVELSNQQVLGYEKPKEALDNTQAVVAEVKDSDGNTVHQEAIDNPERLAELEGRGEVEVKSPEQVQLERAEAGQLDLALDQQGVEDGRSNQDQRGSLDQQPSQASAEDGGVVPDGVGADVRRDLPNLGEDRGSAELHGPIQQESGRADPPNAEQGTKEAEAGARETETEDSTDGSGRNGRGSSVQRGIRRSDLKDENNDSGTSNVRNDGRGNGRVSPSGRGERPTDQERGTVNGLRSDDGHGERERRREAQTSKGRVRQTFGPAVQRPVDQQGETTDDTTTDSRIVRNDGRGNGRVSPSGRGERSADQKRGAVNDLRPDDDYGEGERGEGEGRSDSGIKSLNAKNIRKLVTQFDSGESSPEELINDLRRTSVKQVRRLTELFKATPADLSETERFAIAYTQLNESLDQDRSNQAFLRVFKELTQGLSPQQKKAINESIKKQDETLPLNERFVIAYRQLKESLGQVQPSASDIADLNQLEEDVLASELAEFEIADPDQVDGDVKTSELAEQKGSKLDDKEVLDETDKFNRSDASIFKERSEAEREVLSQKYPHFTFKVTLHAVGKDDPAYGQSAARKNNGKFGRWNIVRDLRLFNSLGEAERYISKAEEIRSDMSFIPIQHGAKWRLEAITRPDQLKGDTPLYEVTKAFNRASLKAVANDRARAKMKDKKQLTHEARKVATFHHAEKGPRQLHLTEITSFGMDLMNAEEDQRGVPMALVMARGFQRGIAELTRIGVNPVEISEGGEIQTRYGVKPDAIIFAGKTEYQADAITEAHSQLAELIRAYSAIERGQESENKGDFEANKAKKEEIANKVRALGFDPELYLTQPDLDPSDLQQSGEDAPDNSARIFDENGDRITYKREPLSEAQKQVKEQLSKGEYPLGSKQEQMVRTYFLTQAKTHLKKHNPEWEDLKLTLKTAPEAFDYLNQKGLTAEALSLDEFSRSKKNLRASVQWLPDNEVLIVGWPGFYKQKREKQVFILGHELGHVALDKLMSEAQHNPKLMSEYKKEFARLNAPESYTFGEFAVDKFSAWLNSNLKQKAEINKQNGGILNLAQSMLREIYYAIKRMAGREAENTTLSEYFDGMFKAGKLAPSQISIAANTAFNQQPLAAEINRLLNSDTGQKIIEAGKGSWQMVRKGVSALAFSADAQLRQMGRPGKQLADKWKNFLQNTLATRQRWQGELERTLSKYSDEEINTAFERLRKQESGRPTPLMKDLRKFLDGFYREMKTKLPTLGYLKDYFPTVYNPDEISDRRSEFIALLIKHGYNGEGQAASIADTIIEAGDGLGLPELLQGPGASAMKQRTLDKPEFIKDAAEANFITDEPKSVLINYISSVAKRAEYEKEFSDEARIPLDDARTDSEQRMVKIRTLRTLGRFGKNEKLQDKDIDERWHEAIAAGEISQDDLGNYNRYMKEGRINKLHEELKPEDRDRALVLREAYLGRIGQQKISKNARELQSWLVMYESSLTLLFSAFSSVVDFAGPILRSRDFSGMYDAFRVYAQGVKDRESMMERAEALNTVTRSLTDEMIKEMQGQHHIAGKPKQLLETLFKYNGQESLTRYVRAASTAVAEDFIKKHLEKAQAGDAVSLEYLKELGLTDLNELAGAYDKNGIALAWSPDLSPAQRDSARAYQLAVSRFVDSSVIRPDASMRPAWASDPRFMLLWHLKSFFYGFKKVILDQVAEQTAKRYQRQETRSFKDKAAAGVLAAAPSLAVMAFVMLPLAAAGLEMREKIQYGFKESPYDRMDSGDYLQELVSRAGLYGPGELVGNAFSRGGLSSLLGPTYQHAEMLLDDDVSGARAVSRSIPVVNQVYWMREPFEKWLSN